MIALLKAHERERRRIAAVSVELIDTIERRGLHAADGHYSAKIMARHTLKLSNSEAAGRGRAAKALRDLPAVRAAFWDGSIGTCHVNRLARVHANTRVRDALVEVEAHFVTIAESVFYKRFDQLVTDFARQAAEDGTCDINDANHEKRDARLTQDFNLAWHLTAACASLQGAVLHDIFSAFVAAELEADWEKARAEHGDHGAQIVTNVVIDATTFERLLAKLAGAPTPAADPSDKSFRCSTIDGVATEPTESVAAALLGHVRRVVMGSDFWPGCHVPISACQADHTKPASSGGCTCPGNGAPACGRHNRLKQHGYSVRRDPDGHWHTHRCNGTEIL